MIMEMRINSLKQANNFENQLTNFRTALEIEKELEEKRTESHDLRGQLEAARTRIANCEGTISLLESSLLAKSDQPFSCTESLTLAIERELKVQRTEGVKLLA